MNKRHYEHTLPNIRGSLSNTYEEDAGHGQQVIGKSAASWQRNGRGGRR